MKIGIKILLLGFTGITAYILVKGLVGNTTKTEQKKEEDTTIKESITNPVKDAFAGASKDVINFNVEPKLQGLSLSALKPTVKRSLSTGLSSSGGNLLLVSDNKLNNV